MDEGKLAMQPQFGILGPLEVSVDGRRMDLGGPRQRRLLAMLVLHASEIVDSGRLVDAVWEDNPPASAAVTLRTHVASLRRSLRAVGAGDLILTRPPGYGLNVAPDQVDANRFARLVTDGRAALGSGDHENAAATLRRALGMPRGPVLADLDHPRFAEAEVARLDELRLAALEARIDADLTLGRHRDLIAELETLVQAYPFREHLCSQLMLALYRSGRQAAALAAYRAAKQRLDQELGLVPGPALAGLETAILRHDPALALPRTMPTSTTGPAASSTAGAERPPPAPAMLELVRRVPLAGRANELTRLREIWQAVRDGGRRVALVSGEAGVGKTRLVAELTAHATTDAATVLVGQCEQTTLIPYHPVTDALHSNPMADAALTEVPEPARRHLAHLMERTAGSRSVEPVRPDQVAEQQLRFLGAITQLFARMSRAAPLVMVVEEAECVDQASARLLRHLAHRLPERMLLVVCFREPPGGQHPPLLELLADLTGHGLADQVALGPLPEPDLASLVTALTAAPVPDHVVHRLWSYTGGNPFYASELVRDLIARGGLDGADDEWRVPSGVRTVLRERLRRLPATTQQVISCAAVLGRQVDAGLLASVTDLPEDEDALEGAVHAGWLVETGRSWQTRYAFRHALLREAVYDETPALRRQRLHLRAADALAATGLRRGSDVAAAAGHLRAAGSLVDPARAAELSLRAADEAGNRYAWEEAIAHGEAAVAILAQAAAAPGEQAEAAVRTATLLVRSTMDYPRAQQQLEEALAHYQAAGDEHAIAVVQSRLGHVLSVYHQVMDIPRALALFDAAEPVLTHGEAAYALHFNKAMAALFGLRTDSGCMSAQRARQLADELGRDDLSAVLGGTHAFHLFNCGELATAQAALGQAWAAAQDLGDPHIGLETVMGAAMIASMYLLDPATGEAWCRRALALPRFDTLPVALDGARDQLTYALASMGALTAAHEVADRLPDDAVSRRHLRLLDGDWESAERSWAAALERDLGHGDLINALLNAYWLGQVRWLLGGAAAALPPLRRALALGIDGPQLPAELMVRAELARVLAAGGGEADALDEAIGHVARCEEILAGGQEWRGQRGNVELARAAVAAAQARHEEADTAHAGAVETFTTHRHPWKRAEALRSWGGWLEASGRPDAARDRYRAARGTYDQLGAADRWRRDRDTDHMQPGADIEALGACRQSDP